MKKYFYILAVLSIAPTFALAQDLDSDVDAELDQMYSGAEASPVNAAPVTAAPSAGIGSSGNVSGQPIYILNQATPTSTATSSSQLQQSQAQVQKQPTTVIEASPLTESRAEQIRRSRQEAEVQTEQRIVEKLEQSRMEDEKKRANVLFGDRLNGQGLQQAQPVQQQPVQVQPIIVQQPVQQAPVAVEPKEDTRSIVREEIAAAMKVEEEMPLPAVESKYIAGVLGVGDYPDVKQIQGNYAMGVALGSKFDNFIVEGAFMFSNYTVSGQGYYTGNPYSYYPYNNTVYVPDSIDVQQYSGSLAAKVQLFSGVIKPVFGGLVQYSYRGFSWDNKTYGYVNDTKANSHAIDVGTIIGADIEFNPKYSIGVDMRYMWNLSSRVNAPSNSWMTSSNYSTIEKLQYYVMSIAGRVNF